MVQLPLPWPSYLTACSEKATTVLEKRGVQEARKTLDLAGSLRDKCNIWQYSFFFSSMLDSASLQPQLLSVQLKRDAPHAAGIFSKGPQELPLSVGFLAGVGSYSSSVWRGCWQGAADQCLPACTAQAMSSKPCPKSPFSSLPEEQISCRQFQITVNLLAVYQKTST